MHVKILSHRFSHAGQRKAQQMWAGVMYRALHMLYSSSSSSSRRNNKSGNCNSSKLLYGSVYWLKALQEVQTDIEATGVPELRRPCLG